MLHLQKLLIVVIFIVGTLSFGESQKYRRCHVCRSNVNYCALVKMPKITLENCFAEPERVRQNDDGCFHHNHNGKVERGCLSRLAAAQYKDCKESEKCKKCYEDNCNDELYFLNRTTAAPNTHASYESSTELKSEPMEHLSNYESSAESKAPPMAHLSFGMISFILFAIAAF